MSVADIVNYAIIGVIVLFLLIGMFWGLIRGLKKSTFRLAWIVITAVVCFFVAPLITGWLLDLNMTIKMGDQIFKSLRELAVYYIEQIPDFGALIVKNEETLNIFITLFGLVFNAFIFTILFWLIKIILWPVFAIISNLIIRKRDPEGNKVRSHRGFGMLVGLVTGFIVCIITLTPVVGIVNLVIKVNEQTSTTYYETQTDENGNSTEVKVTKGGIARMGEKFDAQKYLDILDEYYTSGISYQIVKYTGIDYFSTLMYKGLSTGTMNKEKVVLEEEATTVLSTMISIKTLTETGFDNLNQEKLKTIIDAAKILVDQVFNIKTVSALGNNLMPVLIDEILNNPDFIIKLPTTGNNTIDGGIVQSAGELKDFMFSTLRNELMRILNIAEILNNEDIICKIINKEATSASTIIPLFSDDIVDDVMDEFFQMQTMSTFMPIIVNTAITYLANDMLKIEDFALSEGNANADAVKELFTNIVKCVFSVYNSLDFDSKFYITNTTLPLAGKLLDSIKNYQGLDEANYKKIINAAEEKLLTFVNGAFESIPQEFSGIKDALLESFRNLSEVQSFESTFAIINSVYDDAMTLVNGMTTGSIKLNLSSIGKVIDALKKTTIFKDSVNTIMEEGLGYVKTLITDDLIEINDVIDNTKSNISKVVSWETELGYLNSFASVATELMNAMGKDNLMDTLLAKDSKLFSNIGNALNEMEKSILFGNEIKNIVNILLNKVENMGISGADIINNTLTQIRNNISTNDNIDWQIEFETIKELISAFKDFETINGGSGDKTAFMTNAGRVLDEVVASKSVLINKDVINGIIESAIDNFAGSIDSNSDMGKIVEKIKTNITTGNISYAQELTALCTLFDEISNIDTNTLNFTDFGKILDSYDEINGTKKSVVVSSIRPDIVLMVINQIDTSSMDPDMVKIVEKLKNNVNSIESYESEFGHLDVLVNQVANITSVDMGTFDFEGFGQMLDDRGTSVMVRPVRVDIINIMVDKITITTGVNDIDLAIADVLTNTKACATKAENGELTYKVIFGDLKKLSNISKSFAMSSFELDNNNLDEITNFGVDLDRLNALNIVPNKSAVMIGKYITTTLLGTNGVQNMLPSDIDSNPYKEQIMEVYNDLVSDIEAVNVKYANYLTNPESNAIEFTDNYFTTDFTALTEKAKQVKAKLDEIHA